MPGYGPRRTTRISSAGMFGAIAQLTARERKPITATRYNQQQRTPTVGAVREFVLADWP